MPTIYDIAQKAGVSTATVSRALRGRPEVVPEVRKRVLEAAEELGYRTNRLARALTQGKTNMIGLVLSEPNGNPFYGDLMQAVSRCCRDHGYETVIMLATLATEDTITRAALFLEEHQVDALLLFATRFHLDHYWNERLPGSPPTMAIGSWLDFRGPTVRADDALGGHMAASHLLSLGHRRIAFVGPRGDWPGTRQVGYKRAMEEAGLPASFIETDGAASAASARRAVLGLGADPEPPTGFVAFNDHTALAATRALHELGLSVPDQASVTGFDNSSLAEFGCPALTSVDLRTEEVARLAVERVVACIDADDEEQEVCVDRVSVAPAVVVRESTGPPPASGA